MWDDAFRWSRGFRLAAGALVLTTSLAGLFLMARTPGTARLARAVAQRIREYWSKKPPLVTVNAPRALGVHAGHLVYLDRPDGESEVVGRVAHVMDVSPTVQRLEVRFTAQVTAELEQGGILKGTSRAIGLEAVIRLLLVPDGPVDEAERAQQAICPVIERELLPEMTARLWPELGELLQTLSAEDRLLLQGAVGEVRAELAPLEHELVERMARVAWDVVGLRGVASGLWRLTSGGVENSAKDVRDWWRRRIGSSVPEDREDPEFLSKEMQSILREELQREWTRFWNEHREEVTVRSIRVLSQRSKDLSRAARERWGPKLYEQVVLPAWREGEDEVIRAVESYAHDFASRRLLTPRGAPRLLLAYALRSELGISNSPLLVLTLCSEGNRRQLRYEPLIPAASARSKAFDARDADRSIDHVHRTESESRLLGPSHGQPREFDPGLRRPSSPGPWILANSAGLPLVVLADYRRNDQ